MLLLQTPVKVIIDVNRAIAFILFVHDVLLNDCDPFEPFHLVHMSLNLSIDFLLLIFDQLRYAILLARSDIELKADTHS